MTLHVLEKPDLQFGLQHANAILMSGEIALATALIKTSAFKQAACTMLLVLDSKYPVALEPRILESLYSEILNGKVELSLYQIIVRYQVNTKIVYQVTTIETDLETGKHVTVYFHKKDRIRFQQWTCQFQGLKAPPKTP